MPEIWRCCKARGRRISFMDPATAGLTSNAAAAAKIGNPEGCFLAGTWRRCSSVTGRFGHAPSSRLATYPPGNSAPIPHFVTGSKSNQIGVYRREIFLFFENEGNGLYWAFVRDDLALSHGARFPPREILRVLQPLQGWGGFFGRVPGVAPRSPFATPG